MSPVVETDAGTDRAGPDAPRAGPTLTYIPALDGIRGVAVLVIMGYHGGVFVGNGGFYSVDTFFALSGFLITSLLLAEWQRTSSVRLRLFWARRARRLLPGLVVMLLGVSLYAAVLVPAGTYPGLRADGLSSLFYVANWHFIANGSNYFDRTGLASPLLHMWSLAVEEQFYLLWPLLVLGVLKARASLPRAVGGLRGRGAGLGARDGHAVPPGRHEPAVLRHRHPVPGPPGGGGAGRGLGSAGPETPAPRDGTVVACRSVEPAHRR